MSRRYGRHVVALGGLAAAIFLLLAGCASAQSVVQPVKANKEAQGPQNPEPYRYSGVTLACKPSGDGQAYSCHRERPSEPLSLLDHVRRWLFRTVRDPVAVVTIGLFVIGGWQVEIARRTAKRELRAYVSLHNFALYDGATLPVPDPARVNQPGIILQVQNTGSTPAYEVLHMALIEVRPVAQEKSIITPKTVNVSSSYLAKDALLTKQLDLGRTLTQQELQGIRSGTHGIYIIGRVDYRDAFKRKRFMTYRLRYVGMYPPPQTGQLINYCDEGNKAN